MGSLGCLSHEVFELGGDLLDGVQVGTVGRHEDQPGPHGPDGAPDGRLFVAGQIVHDDDVTPRQRRYEALVDIVGEALGVDRLPEPRRTVEPRSSGVS